MGINEIDHTIYPNTVGREDCNVLPRSFKTLAEAEAAGFGVHCWGALGGHRWCLLCHHSNGVLGVKRLPKNREAFLGGGGGGERRRGKKKKLQKIKGGPSRWRGGGGGRGGNKGGAARAPS